MGKAVFTAFDAIKRPLNFQLMTIARYLYVVIWRPGLEPLQAFSGVSTQLIRINHCEQNSKATINFFMTNYMHTWTESNIAGLMSDMQSDSSSPASRIYCTFQYIVPDNEKALFQSVHFRERQGLNAINICTF